MWKGIRILPVLTRTAAEAAVALDCQIGQIGKSLVFYNTENDEPILIIVSGANRVDKEVVSRYLGYKIKTASPEYCLRVTGFAVGGVPPVGHKSPIRTLIDQDLEQYNQIWVSAGTENSLFPINPSELIKMTKGEVINIK